MADISAPWGEVPPSPDDEVQVQVGDGLVPFPTTYDPDAELPQPDRRESMGEDELRVPITTEEEEDEEGEVIVATQAEEEDPLVLRSLLMDLGPSKGEGDGEGEAEVEEEAMNMDVEVGELIEVAEPEVATKESEAVQAEKGSPELQSANSSPLSEPPDLPTGPIVSPENEIIALPSTSSTSRPRQPPAKRNIDASQSPPHAESSTSAAKRAKVVTISPPRERRNEISMFDEAHRNIVTGKRVRKQRQALEFDDIEGLSDGDRVGQGRTVKSKSAGGKPRARKKADGAFTGHAGQAKGPPRAKNLTDAQLRDQLKGKSRETQIGPCLRPRYTGWGKCCQCVGKVAGDSCRFKEFRIFDIDPASADILDTADFENTRLKEDMTALPREFNTAWEEEHISRTERTVAPLLLPVISRELRHIINNKAVVREVDVVKHRSLCDFCSSTIFGGYFFCKKCGRDYCLQCERYFSDSLEGMRESPWDLPDVARPRLLRCTLAPPVKGKLAVVDNEPERPLSTSRRRQRDNSPKIEKANSPDVAPDTPEQRPEADRSPETSATGINGHVPAATLSEVEDRQDRVPQPQLDETERPGDEPVQTQESETTLVPDPTPAQPASEEKASTVETPPQQPSVVANGHEADHLAPPPPQSNSSRSARTRTVKPPATRAPKVMHVRPDLVPITRFHRQDLEAHWTKLLSFVLDGEGHTPEDRARWLSLEDDDELRNKVDQYVDKYFPKSVNGSNTDGDGDPAKYYTKSTNNDQGVTCIPDPAGLEDRSHAFMLVQADDLDNTLFDRLWAKGEPMVVDRVGSRFKQSWTPDAFIQRFGKEECHVIDCQVEKIKATTVGEFFETFKNPGLRQSKGIWKLKDWPSTNDFQSAYPDLYNDFCDSLPVPDFTRREGVLNLYAHFPAGPTKPDIGPKMYNAFEAQQTKGGQGSTRLHMDVADAINIMLHASTRADGHPGCAVWDLFRAEDADKIRLFLKEKFGGTVYFADPIHSQMFYLDAELRKALAERYGVVSFRVYQYPGQAVFIPAGCAHQVCNLADCIKIALDFVSPHNVSRCQQLMLDFRKENYVKAWKDDVLQLYNVMWFSWLNAQETRQRRLDESEAAERARLHALTNGNGNHDVGPGGHTSTHVRTLTTQVSSVRDEPTPTPQTQSPVQSKESTPVPTLANTATANSTSGGEDQDARTKDRAALSKILFEAMLKRNDSAPPLPINEDQKPTLPAPSANLGRQDEDLGIKTTEFVKKGLIPLDVAFQAMQQSMRNEQKAVADEEGEGEMMEFSLGDAV